MKLNNIIAARIVGARGDKLAIAVGPYSELLGTE